MPSDLKARLEARKAAAIKQIIADANALDDEALVHDMIEGETSFFEILEHFAERLAEAEAMVDAQKTQISALQERKGRYEARGKRIRELIADAMRIAGERKAELPRVTLSLANGRQKVIVTDAEALPDQFIRVKKEPDLRALAEELKEGAIIEGACLSNGGEQLMVRSK